MIHFVAATQVKPTLDRASVGTHRTADTTTLIYSLSGKQQCIQSVHCLRQNLCSCPRSLRGYVSSSGIHDKKAHCATQPNATAMSCTCTSSGPV